MCVFLYDREVETRAENTMLNSRSRPGRRAMASAQILRHPLNPSWSRSNCRDRDSYLVVEVVVVPRLHSSKFLVLPLLLSSFLLDPTALSSKDNSPGLPCKKVSGLRRAGRNRQLKRVFRFAQAPLAPTRTHAHTLSPRPQQGPFRYGKGGLDSAYACSGWSGYLQVRIAALHFPVVSICARSRNLFRSSLC